MAPPKTTKISHFIKKQFFLVNKWASFLLLCRFTFLQSPLYCSESWKTCWSNTKNHRYLINEIDQTFYSFVLKAAANNKSGPVRNTHRLLKYTFSNFPKFFIQFWESYQFFHYVVNRAIKFWWWARLQCHFAAVANYELPRQTEQLYQVNKQSI